MGVVVNIDPNPGGVFVSIDGVLKHVEQGAQVEVPDEKVGRPPSGTPGEDDHDPGEGLLAATACWAPVKKRTSAKKHDDDTTPDVPASEGS